MIRKASHAGGIFGFISQFGYLAVAALILRERVPAYPQRAILPLSGFLATQTEMTLPVSSSPRRSAGCWRVFPTASAACLPGAS
ncbi:MAG: hypothetical protein ACLTKG_08285 [Collinsella intestinalis]